MRRSRAIIIGAADYGDYERSRLKSHFTIARSAVEWERFLKTDPLWESTGDTGTDNQVRRLEHRELQSVDGVLSEVRLAAAEANDMLLVVYIGHGAWWSGVADSQVHLAVETSRNHDPWTWLSSSYLYYLMRESRASSKILIADCCNSDKLNRLDDGTAEDEAVTEAFNASRPEGTLVVRAVQHVSYAAAEGCPRLASRELQECTALSGHLLDMLRRGIRNGGDVLKPRTVVNRLSREMLACPVEHPAPGGTLDGSLGEMELFTNKLADRVERSRIAPVTAEEWVSVLLSDSCDLGPLLADPAKINAVVAGLARNPGPGEERARDIDEQALRTLPRNLLADYLRIRVSHAPAA
jgi:hypothetical protein